MAELNRVTGTEAPHRRGTWPRGVPDGALPEDLDELRERLFAEFPRLDVVTVDTVIRRCIADLDSVHESARAEMVDRLARSRLTELGRGR